MAASDSDNILSLFVYIVGIVYRHECIISKQAAASKGTIYQLLSKIVIVNKTKFSEYDFKTSHLDDFLKIYVTMKYSEFWCVCKFIFTLSQGFWFYNDKERMVVNLQEMSFTSLHRVYNKIVQQIIFFRQLTFNCM